VHRLDSLPPLEKIQGIVILNQDNVVRGYGACGPGRAWSVQLPHGGEGRSGWVGYAAPGAVLGVGILIPLAALDNTIADAVYNLTGWDPGLVLTGTAFAVVYAYAVRFFAIAQGAAESAMDRVSPSLPMAARSLGRTAGGALRAVYVPLIRGSVGTALLLVFVDSVKELPATLLLRPFNYNTLSTRVYEKASLEQIGQAAPAALLVIAVGLAAVALAARASR